MHTYREQAAMLAPVKLREGETKRINCPFCGGRNTLTLRRSEGARVWNCFKASCVARGVVSAPVSAGTLREKISRPYGASQSRYEHDTDSRPQGAPLPPHTDPATHDAALSYLANVSSLEAYEEGWAKIRYAPGAGRVLFFYASGEGALGRSLGKSLPKWTNYGPSDDIFHVSKPGVASDTAVVVEDAASACSVARVDGITGCALAGTSLSIRQRTVLRTFRRVWIALDADASRKSVEMLRKVESHTNARVIFLSDDLKYVPVDRIREMLK